jgi:hypothetical protein
MTDLGATLFAFFATDAPLVAAVSDRIWPGRLPQEPILPAITYTRLAAPPETTQTTYALRRIRVAFGCWATTYDAAAAIGALLISSLAHKPIEEGGGNCLLLGDHDVAPDPETGLFRRLVEFRIYHEE